MEAAVLQRLSQTDQDRLKHEAVEHLREVAVMDFTVLPESFNISVVDNEAHVMFKVILTNGDLMSADAVFKREGSHWHFSRVGTLCCGEH